ncbi:hypothetical protein [Arsenicicoccus dermatophilus]|uniref:hypothetical protein n=1 Tax=Arsenicicoccus dermatophilus TaxID=1076331 RepID=UPI001F4C8DB9|nr:hypothetical protein [Arsenicicoccus dermatophilus]MCH8612400.1 hypothetical protein [Arsenicicoccus dermatophilus]
MTDPTSIPSFPPAADEHPLRGQVIDALHDDGLMADIDADGDVSFKVQGQQLFVRCIEGEVTIMRVFGQWQIGDDIPQDELSQLRACNELNLRMSVVKSGLAGGTLVVTAEHVMLPGTDVKTLLPMTTSVVLTAVHTWHQIVTGDLQFDTGLVPGEGDQPEGGLPS